MRYNTITEVFDFGPFISKIILELDHKLSDCVLDNNTFHSYLVRKDKKTGEIVQVPKSWDSYELCPSVGERKILSAYLSDNEGVISKGGSYITLEMEVDPRIWLGSAMAYDGTFNAQVDCEYTIKQIKPIAFGDSKIENMVFSELNTNKILLADDFSTGKSTFNGVQLTYAAFQPKENRSNRPLIIWLHGAGEGGTDPIMAIIGNKAANLVSEDIQQYFGGSYILAPQSPTMWMDDGTGQYNTDGSSMYVESLKNLIDEYIMSHEDIDKNRIYIGGCSNGGFMTMKMILAYTHMFAAAFPICEALLDKHITDSDINSIKNLPIWFTHATNDPIVAINLHTEATYNRLIKAGANNVHFSCFPNITDHTGKYFNLDSSPYEYHGHFSWIPALNNECTDCINDRKVTIFEWLAKQKRSENNLQ